jgi:hypothetical protein
MPPLYAFFPCRGGPGVSSVAGCNCGGGYAHTYGQLDMNPNASVGPNASTYMPVDGRPAR